MQVSIIYWMLLTTIATPAVLGHPANRNLMFSDLPAPANRKLTVDILDAEPGHQRRLFIPPFTNGGLGSMLESMAYGLGLDRMGMGMGFGGLSPGMGGMGGMGGYGDLGGLGYGMAPGGVGMMDVHESVDHTPFGDKMTRVQSGPYGQQMVEELVPYGPYM